MKSKAEMMKRLRALRKAEGWVQLNLWVPRELVPKVRAYVKKLTADSAAAFNDSGRSRKVNKGEK